jgi:metal iron transporter
MNKTSHTDEPFEGDDGYNQSPNPNSSDLTTNADFNGLVNSRASLQGDSRALPDAASNMSGQIANNTATETPGHGKAKLRLAYRSIDHGQPSGGLRSAAPANPPPAPAGSADNGGTPLQRLKDTLVKIGSFIGPGFMISVAYIDPGNYSTDIAAGASYRFRLLFIVLLSNVFAVFLQSLAIKLGTVSGLNLAQACRAFLPRWLNYILYVFAEAAIIATDIAEVNESLAISHICVFKKRKTKSADSLGHWICDCLESSGPRDPAGGRMCHFHHRCHGPTHLLPP